ncbi:hypothetical protein FGO68_gene13277 [Halteria grandinella]|uniref:Protein kinase domain-containing protein n=1 Tax=Halteria grandinella TaxID=5974 RepID=A0A8J8T9P3_HALGN|nr:hypothetical protein FGO68_gene13277 [Halteria grandinella]
MDYFQGCRNGYQRVQSFELGDLSQNLPADYNQFVHEYALEVSQTLLELHQKDIVHGDINLKNVLSVHSSRDPSYTGLHHKFKLTNLQPWVTETFPSNENDQSLLLSLKKQSQNVKKGDILSLMKQRDIQQFGQSMLNLLNGQTKPQDNNLYISENHQQHIPESWLSTTDATGLIELITKCLQLCTEVNPLDKLIEICNIAVRAYQTNINPAYEPPKHLLKQDLLTEVEINEIQNSEKRFMAENLNDRGVFYYLRGDYSTAFTITKKALQINPSNLEAFLNMNLLEWRLAKLRDDELLLRAEEMNVETFDTPTREFVRLMFKYAISYGFHETDLLSIGGYESSQFYPTMQKILKAVK